jgi:hypothetical protein
MVVRRKLRVAAFCGFGIARIIVHHFSDWAHRVISADRIYLRRRRHERRFAAKAEAHLEAASMA